MDVAKEKQDHILEKISSWDGVAKATRLKPDASDPELSRMSQVYLHSSADAASIVKKLSETPEIEEASVPAARKPYPS
jgi:hypothetical protein